MEVNIWWIRRDLRLHDNQALQGAVSSAENVIPLFILDPKLLNSTNVGKKRLAFLFASLFELDAGLKARGSKLLVRKGNPADVFQELTYEITVKRVSAQRDYSPYSSSRDEQVAKLVPLDLVPGISVSDPESIRKESGEPYRVFTPYMRRWKSLYLGHPMQVLPAPDYITTPVDILSERIPELPNSEARLVFEPIEESARGRLQEFTSGLKAGIYNYADLRNRMDVDGTAGVSPYLRLGLLSVRECVQAARQAMADAPDDSARAAAEVWLNELIWREFYLYILYHFPNVMVDSFREEFRAVNWNNDLDDYRAWCEGRTGYPIVDAAMRQLLETGWMHNRGRMIVASFLVKDLAINWQWGEKFFMQQLIDGDPAANNGGWQWTAGTGTDAAPYFRIFNPVLQAKKFDPQGTYIRKWVPELSAVPLKFIHAPWEMPQDIQLQVNCIIGENYPHPIIDHRFARERILDIFNKAKNIKES